MSSVSTKLVRYRPWLNYCAPRLTSLVKVRNLLDEFLAEPEMDSWQVDKTVVEHGGVVRTPLPPRLLDDPVNLDSFTHLDSLRSQCPLYKKDMYIGTLTQIRFRRLLAYGLASVCEQEQLADSLRFMAHLFIQTISGINHSNDQLTVESKLVTLYGAFYEDTYPLTRWLSTQLEQVERILQWEENAIAAFYSQAGDGGSHDVVLLVRGGVAHWKERLQIELPQPPFAYTLTEYKAALIKPEYSMSYWNEFGELVSGRAPIQEEELSRQIVAHYRREKLKLLIT